MILMDEQAVYPLLDNLFPLKPEILGANMELWLPNYGFDKLTKVQYVGNSSSSSSNMTFPTDLKELSQIVFMLASTGSRSSINDSGFAYFIYSPLLCDYSTVIGGTKYITCPYIPKTSYCKIVVPSMRSYGSTESNEFTQVPMIKEDFLSTQKVYYNAASGLYEFNYGKIPGNTGTTMIWYLPNSFKEEETA